MNNLWSEIWNELWNEIRNEFLDLWNDFWNEVGMISWISGMYLELVVELNCYR